jgi:rhamnulokinase
MASRTVLAIDLGAESGRVLAIYYDGQHMQTEELHRFPNIPVYVRGTLYWDILRLWNDIQIGIGNASNAAALGVETWGVDFALLDRAGNLLGNPVHYRDTRTEGMVEYVFSKAPRKEVFMQTGIQIMPINTLYQLTSLEQNDAPRGTRSDLLLADGCERQRVHGFHDDSVFQHTHADLGLRSDGQAQYSVPII